MKTDYEYPVGFAKLAKKVGAETYVLTSSAGTDPNAYSLYMKVKGEAERDIEKVGLPHLIICNPGFLVPRSEEAKCGEKMTSCIISCFFCCFSWKISIPLMAKAQVNYYLKHRTDSDREEVVKLDNKTLLKYSNMDL